jgi:ornithine cyclodeaminase/alanine dehydrogenase-like protein (mu-crystallin family)
VPLLLSNEDVMSVLSMDDCLSAMEQAFFELGAGRAVSRPRSELVVPQPESGRHYLLKTWDAALPGSSLAAIRITSNMMQETGIFGGRRLDPLPLAGGRFVGLVLLFDLKTLELVGIIHDARIQVMRAGATYGVAAKYLAREDAQVMGLLGSGGQAREQLSAIARVRRLQRVKVYSPTEANRRRFSREMSERLGIEVVPCNSPGEVVKGADIVTAATSSLEAVFDGEWLEPGQLVTLAGPSRIDEPTRRRPALIVLQTNEQTLRWSAGSGHSAPGAKAPPVDRDRMALLPDIVSGRHAGRARPDDITLFGGFNTFGPGTAYAAVGAVVLERARRNGIGRELPAQWFVQRESS